MEQKDREHFDNMLEADTPGRTSRGTSALMNLMGGPSPPRAPQGVK